MESESYMPKYLKFRILLCMKTPFVFPQGSLIMFEGLEKARKFSARLESSLILPTPQVQSPHVM